MGGRLAFILTVFCVLVIAAEGRAAIYVGRAAEGTRVLLETDLKGTPELVEFGRYKARCNRGWRSIKSPITGFRAPFTAVSANRVLDTGDQRVRRRVQGIEGRVDVRARWRFGAKHTSSDRWRGRYRTSGVFRQHGEILSRCEAAFRFRLKPK